MIQLNYFFLNFIKEIGTTLAYFSFVIFQQKSKKVLIKLC